MKTLRAPFGDGRDLPCTQCGVSTPDAAYTGCCGMPMCDNCRPAHPDCSEDGDEQAAPKAVHGVPLLTGDEHRALTLLARFVAVLVDIVGPDTTRRADMAEACLHVHALQNMILAQAAARSYPGMFRRLGHTLRTDELTGWRCTRCGKGHTYNPPRCDRCSYTVLAPVFGEIP